MHILKNIIQNLKSRDKLMKVFMLFLTLFYFTNGYCFILTPKEYVEACKKNMDTSSVCYGYFKGVVDDFFVYGNNLCFNKNDKEIYAIAINGVENFVKKHPKEQEMIFPSEIIKETLEKKFSCRAKNPA